MTPHLCQLCRAFLWALGDTGTPPSCLSFGRVPLPLSSWAGMAFNLAQKKFIYQLCALQGRGGVPLGRKTTSEQRDIGALPPSTIRIFTGLPSSPRLPTLLDGAGRGGNACLP